MEREIEADSISIDGFDENTFWGGIDHYIDVPILESFSQFWGLFTTDFDASIH